ncbi:MAG TPA: hypothetical protein VGK35_01835 [Actinotalea sp.]
MVVGAGWLASGAPGLSKDGHPVVGYAEPSAEVVALADAAHLSEEGRQLLYAAHPEILDATAFAGRCDDGEAPGSTPADGPVGCFLQSGGSASIVLYEPADPRLHGYVVESAAHETLHAAWTRLGRAERDRLLPPLEAEVAALPADDPLRVQIAGSVGSHPENRPTELFAYVGTEIWRAGGLGSTLEDAYARFVTDRAALVAVKDSWMAVLDDAAATVQSASQELANQQSANAMARAQLTGDTAAVAHYRQAYEAKAAEVAALPAQQRRLLELSWVWWDGTDLPMAPAAQTLSAAADLLARDDAALAARGSALAVEEADVASEEVRVQSLMTDLQALRSQLYPAAASS